MPQLPDLHLLVTRGFPGRQPLFAYQPGERVSLGRSPENRIQLRLMGVSRKHCLLQVQAGPQAGWVVHDLGSKVGTTVNHERITSGRLLRHGDVLRLGGAKIEVGLGSPPNQERTGQDAFLVDVVCCVECGRTLAEASLRLGHAMSYGDHVLCSECAGKAAVAEALGPYRLLSRLGAGACGEVFRALHPAGSQLVALKRIRLVGQPSDEVMTLFKRETRALSKLQHPNVVQVYDVGATEESLYFAMELVDGGDLLALIQRDGRVPVWRACRVGLAVLAALDYAHGLGFVHRDVKPQNVLVTPLDEIKLADFGLSKNLEDASLAELTRTNESLGTPRYMPPEQISDARSADRRADIYAVAATLYHAVAGTPLFHEHQDIRSLFRCVVEVRPERLDDRFADVPSGFAEALDWALSKDRAARPQSARQLAEALHAYSRASFS